MFINLAAVSKWSFNNGLFFWYNIWFNCWNKWNSGRVSQKKLLKFVPRKNPSQRPTFIMSSPKHEIILKTLQYCLHLKPWGWNKDDTLSPSWSLYQEICYKITNLMLPFFFYFIFNWRIIALWSCVGFCHTPTWISHNCTNIPSHWNLHLTSHPIPPL